MTGHGPGWPTARAGMRVGLLGGSFDPAHEGHAHVTRAALKRLSLDRVWWLVSPGNPLKSQGPAALEQRLVRARAVMRHPRVEITDLERRLDTRYTADTLAKLQARYPGVRFVWLMGADNLANLHLWENWQDIMNRVPVAVLARPGDRLSARLSPAARRYRQFYQPQSDAPGLALMRPPAWTFLNLPMRPDSSTVLRDSGAWVNKPACGALRDSPQLA